jgi:hypothetical protein
MRAQTTDAPVTDDAPLPAAADRVQTEFLSKQPGFIRRELLKGKENQWVDMIYWTCLEAAEQAERNAASSPVCSTYFTLMAHADAGVLHFERVKTYASM